MENQIERIKNKLEHLRKLDTAFELFGAEKHQYILNPRLTPDNIKQFEIANKVSLPSGYAEFLITIGNGGAGPFYGLEPLENVLFDDLDYKREDGLMNPSKPFLLTEAWNLEFEPTVNEDENEEEYENQYEVFSNLYFDSEHTNGLIAICNYGCGINLNLVVNGQEYGNIWTDDRGNDGGIYPSIELGNKEKITFLNWYELWLDNSITAIKDNVQNTNIYNNSTRVGKKSWWKFW
jgi:hypothetical protein